MRALFLGAGSDIAIETAKIMADDGFECILVSRNKDTLCMLSKDLSVRNNKENPYFPFDLTDFDNLESFLEDITKDKVIDIGLIFQGYLPDNEKAIFDLKESKKTTYINFVSPILCANFLAKKMINQGHGAIVGISSVAGDKVRKSNLVYGASKAGFSAYLDGLRQYLYKKGVHVLSVKPGFIRTKMTKHLSFPSFLIGEKESVAKDIYKAIKEKKDTLYTPSFYYPIMLSLKLIPNFIFKRL